MKSKHSETNETNELQKINETQELPEPKQKKKGRLTMTEFPDLGEIEIQKEASGNRPSKRIRFPKENSKRFRLKPAKFKETLKAVKAWNAQVNRDVAIYPTSLESPLGYSSLFRVLSSYMSDMVVYYRSREGGELSLEEALDRVYTEEVMEEEGFLELFDLIMNRPVDSITFLILWKLARNSRVAAENVWEWIKREAKNEFESGHLAADSLEPVGRTKQAWMRAKYIAIRESFSREYRPQGGIELSMIDLLSQSWFMVQYWTKELSQRMMTEPRRLPPEYLRQKEWHQSANPRGWQEEKWDWEVPTISESEAVNQAAQMLDRFQRMYFRALRQLRDWRRYTPQLTINNANQVNIASDGGQQVNVSNPDDEKARKITS